MIMHRLADFKFTYTTLLPYLTLAEILNITTWIAMPHLNGL